MFPGKMSKPSWVTSLDDDDGDAVNDVHDAFKPGVQHQDDYNEEDYEITGYDLCVDWYK